MKTSRGQGRAQRREIENLIRSRPMLFVPGEDGFDPKQEWADLFDEAWPATRAAGVELVGRCEKEYEERSALLKLFHVPSGWSCCEYDSAPGVEPERLWFRLGLRDFKQYHPGGGWCVNPSPDWATRDTPQVSDTGVGTVCRFRSNHPPPLCNALR